MTDDNGAQAVPAPDAPSEPKATPPVVRREYRFTRQVGRVYLPHPHDDSRRVRWSFDEGHTHMLSDAEATRLNNQGGGHVVELVDEE